MNSQIKVLYEQSKNGKKFKNLYKRIISRDNIVLAFRKLRKNKGGKTAGYDGETIKDMENMEMDDIIEMVRSSLNYYKPDKVRRVYINKEDGSKRPLGIPTIRDRLIQTCILQVLEPICEARFHEKSYGFRIDRSAHDAVAQVKNIVELGKNYYCVDVDIEGFFDNVDHNILMRKVWGIGIQDKRVISILKAILKSEIVDEGIPDKGTPQGGIISPLLANIYLTELDEWVCGQWEDYETHKTYNSNSKKYEMLRRRNIKEIWYVRYADDFKIFCKDKTTATKIYYATTEWLQKRLKLNVSPSKSGITNLTKQRTEFLGYSFKVSTRQTANKRTNKRVLEIRISKKSLKRIQIAYKKRVQDLLYQPRQLRVMFLNQYIQGIHNYYKLAHRVGHDLIKPYLIGYRKIRRYEHYGALELTSGKGDLVYEKKYSRYNFTTFGYNGQVIYPLPGIRGTTHPPRKYGLNPYERIKTEYVPPTLSTGRGSGLYYSNRIGTYYQQKGNCHITGEPLVHPECHHKIPRSQGGTDEYQNLVLIEKKYHIALHRKDKDFAKDNGLNKRQIKKYEKLLELID